MLVNLIKLMLHSILVIHLVRLGMTIKAFWLMR